MMLISQTFILFSFRPADQTKGIVYVNPSWATISHPPIHTLSLALPVKAWWLCVLNGPGSHFPYLSSKSI